MSPVQPYSFHPRDMETFWAWDGEELVLNVLGTPSAKRDKIGKPRGNVLKISVKAAAEDGKATEYMVKFLAKEFGVHRRDVRVVFGQTTLNKQFRIHAPNKIPQSIKEYVSCDS